MEDRAIPFYEFRCSECDETVEVLLKLGKSIKKCPECGEKKLEKLISKPIYHDLYSPMHARRGRGVGGYGRCDPGQGTNIEGLSGDKG